VEDLPQLIMDINMFRISTIPIFLCGMFLLSACDFAPTRPAVTAMPANTSVSENVVASYFAGAELQAETKSQLREIKRALEDMLNLSIPDLQAQRYADYQMTPGQWSLGELLNAYFLSVDGSPQKTDARFFEDSKQAAAQRVLKQKLRDVEAAISHGAGE
jgi:hypothetical protein